MNQPPVQKSTKPTVIADAATSPSPATAGAGAKVGLFSRPMLYDQPLTWFLLLSTLDLLLTWVILHLGGAEVNWLARAFLEKGDLYGLIAFKFTMVLGIILLCDFVGRRDEARGRFIARMAVAITCLPIILALVQLFSWTHF